MAFIKTHLISLLSGVAALAFIVVGVIGMMSDSVVKEMDERARLRGQIQSLRSAPKNQDCINAEADRGRRFKDEYDKTLVAAQRINAREPLMDGVFPKPESEKAAYYFRDAYKRAVWQLPRGTLVAGSLPTEFEIQEAQNDIAELRAHEEQKRAEGGEAAPDIAERSPERRGPGAERPGAVISAGGPSVSEGPAAASKEYDPKYDPKARAQIAKARRIRCYVSPPEAEAQTFHISPIWDPELKPTAEEMWYAQVGLWVQQDVVAAIAEMNDEAARKLKPEEAYVENMPVKRIERIRVLGYWVTEEERIEFGTFGRSGGGDIQAMQASFTGRACDDEFDVIRFTVEVVVDQRDLLVLVDRITKRNFYQLIGLRYDAITSEDRDYQEGYLYGTAPVVRTWLNFEGYMARNVYEKLFPAEVRERLGITDGKKKKREP